jgi:hypothetical protein
MKSKDNKELSNKLLKYCLIYEIWFHWFLKWSFFNSVFSCFLIYLIEFHDILEIKIMIIENIESDDNKKTNSNKTSISS